ncbi:MAG: hypothetical protein OIF57_12865, partial [Marinobacterium sp.]|nr:hypothetical protein [Marinobacterium sp.]
FLADLAVNHGKVSPRDREKLMQYLERFDGAWNEYERNAELTRARDAFLAVQGFPGPPVTTAVDPDYPRPQEPFQVQGILYQSGTPFDRLALHNDAAQLTMITVLDSPAINPRASAVALPVPRQSWAGGSLAVKHPGLAGMDGPGQLQDIVTGPKTYPEWFGNEKWGYRRRTDYWRDINLRPGHVVLLDRSVVHTVRPVTEGERLVVVAFYGVAASCRGSEKPCCM